jgi:hypothetical protein
LCTFQNIFEARFPVNHKIIHRHKNGWIKQGLKIVCESKRRLYVCSRDINDEKKKKKKKIHTKYCKILNKVVLEAKKQHYNRLIAKPDNKIKTTWNITKTETGKIHVTEQITSFQIIKNKRCRKWC